MLLDAKVMREKGIAELKGKSECVSLYERERQHEAMTTPAPETATPAPVTTTPAPAPVTTTPATTTPAPMTTTPAPMTTTPAPMTTMPAAVTTMAAPVTTTAASVTMSTAPTTTAPDPENRDQELQLCGNSTCENNGDKFTKWTRCCFCYKYIHLICAGNWNTYDKVFHYIFNIVTNTMTRYFLSILILLHLKHKMLSVDARAWANSKSTRRFASTKDVVDHMTTGNLITYVPCFLNAKTMFMIIVQQTYKNLA